MGEVTVYSSMRCLCSPAEVAGRAAVSGAVWVRGVATATGACMAIRGWRLMRTDSSPSEISSSEIPDSSSNSINFFTLRISIREPLNSLCLGEAGACGFERELVADGPQPEDASGRDVG